MTVFHQVHYHQHPTTAFQDPVQSQQAHYLPYSMIVFHQLLWLQDPMAVFHQARYHRHLMLLYRDRFQIQYRL
jgi:hypothetical protein